TRRSFVAYKDEQLRTVTAGTQESSVNVQAVRAPGSTEIGHHWWAAGLRNRTAALPVPSRLTQARALALLSVATTLALSWMRLCARRRSLSSRNPAHLH